VDFIITSFLAIAHANSSLVLELAPPSTSDVATFVSSGINFISVPPHLLFAPLLCHWAAIRPLPFPSSLSSCPMNQQPQGTSLCHLSNKNTLWFWFIVESALPLLSHSNIISISTFFACDYDMHEVCSLTQWLQSNQKAVMCS
jgi:hypothetical protein